MRIIFALCGLTLLAAGLLIWRSFQTPALYGEFIGAPNAPVADVVDRPERFMGKFITLEGKISEQCKTMGCYFFFHSGNKTLRVELQQIAMTAPMHEGGTARVEGQIATYSDGYQLLANAIEFK